MEIFFIFLLGLTLLVAILDIIALRIFLRTQLIGALLVFIGGIILILSNIIYFLTFPKIIISFFINKKNNILYGISAILLEVSLFVYIIGILLLITIESGRLSAAFKGVSLLNRFLGNVNKLPKKEKYKPILKRWQGILFGVLFLIMGYLFSHFTSQRIIENKDFIILSIGLILFSLFLK